MKESDFLLLKQETKELLRKNKELLNVSYYPLFDKELANVLVPDQVQKLFEDFHMLIENDLNTIKESYKNRDWITVHKMTEKMIENASCGTVRLYVAFLLLDGYLTLGYSTSKEALYAQAMEVLDETLTELAVNKPFMEKITNIVSKNQENYSMSTRKTTILVVEDNPIAAKMADKLFSELGCEVEHVEDGGKAIEMAIKNNYDGICMDIGLPDVSGLEACIAIRKHEAEQGITPVPIVAVTGNNSPEEVENYLKAGMQEVISKPLTKEMARHFLSFCKK